MAKPIRVKYYQYTYHSDRYLYLSIKDKDMWLKIRAKIICIKNIRFII